MRFKDSRRKILGIGHAFFDETCPKTMMAAFFDHPSDAVDISCVLSMPHARASKIA